MAPKKKIEETTEVNEDSAAASTLAPNSKPADDPKSRYETLAAMIGAAATARDEQLTKWYNEMIAQIGTEAKTIGDGQAASNRSTVDMKPSDAKAGVAESLKQAVKDDLVKIFESDKELTEDFKAKAATLFEAAIEARIKLFQEELRAESEKEFEEQFNVAVDIIAEETEKFLDHAANVWMEENQVAIESALRNEIASEFMGRLKQAFIDTNIDVPEDKVDVVDQLAQTVEELETRLNDSISENADLKKEVESFKKKEIIEKLSEGLTLVQSEKLKELAEAVDTSDIDDYSQKVTVIKESTFVKDEKKSEITEQLEEVDENNKPEKEKGFTSPQMKSYVQAIDRTAR